MMMMMMMMIIIIIIIITIIIIPGRTAGGSSAVGRGQAGRPDHDQQHRYHHAPMVKPEAATAVVELLMMGVRTPKHVDLYINVK
jgi:hypothetical protein